MKKKMKFKKKKTDGLTVKLAEPDFKINQTVYVPMKNRVLEATVLAYDAGIAENGKGKDLIGGVFGYQLNKFVMSGYGIDNPLSGKVPLDILYSNEKEAKEASRFLKVDLSEDDWKLAIGDDGENDETSKYHVKESGLSTCCANIDEAREVLEYCQEKKGLIVHERNYLVKLLAGHDFEEEKKGILGEVLDQLEFYKIFKEESKKSRKVFEKARKDLKIRYD
ncbi:hypothetical protein ACFLZZ_00200 [Nanoarchaeota archaeon]